MITVRLPKEIEDRLTALAKATGRTKTFYVRQAILEHIEDMEDLLIAEKRWEDLQAGRSRTYSLEEVERELGLENIV
jgi:RHH-type transcriptional regulator, rel operon repressor / antitoxin RelB